MDSHIHDELKKLNSELSEKSFNFDISFINNCDVIGFDLDHTLAVYNNKEMSDLLLHSFTKFLAKDKNYPDEIHNLDNNSDITKEFSLKMMGTDIILDCINGNALRIDEDKKVIKAFHGFKELNKNDVIFLI